MKARATHNRRFPSAFSLMHSISVLRATIPLDDGVLKFEWRQSNSGTPNFRVAGVTCETPWIVDLYCGHYYRATVGIGYGEVWRSLPSLVAFLRKNLGLPPIESDQKD